MNADFTTLEQLHDFLVQLGPEVEEMKVTNKSLTLLLSCILDLADHIQRIESERQQETQIVRGDYL